MDGKVHTLVVDDEPELRKVLRSLLELLGYEVEEAMHGQDAVDRIRRRIPGLIVSDMDMPVMDGCQFCRLLGKNPAWQQIPVLLITGYAWRAPLDEALSHVPRSTWMAKPFTLEELREQLRRLSAAG